MTPRPKLLTPDKESEMYCNFCGKDSKEVDLIISAPSAMICNECVKTCMKIVLEKNDRDAIDIVRKAMFLEIYGTDA